MMAGGERPEAETLSAALPIFLAGTPVGLSGIAFGTDRDLKIGFLLDSGSPTPFDPTSTLGGYHNIDWGVLIDTSFITASITKKVRDAAAANVPPVSVSGVNVHYEEQITTTGRENLIWVYAPATASTALCSVPVSIRADISPRMCRKADGRSSLFACTAQSATPHPNACIFVEKTVLFFIAAALDALTVCGGPCPPPPTPPPRCQEMTEVHFEVGKPEVGKPPDVFYGTVLDTDNLFYIGGRSTLIDATGASRPQVPDCP